MNKFINKKMKEMGNSDTLLLNAAKQDSFLASTEVSRDEDERLKTQNEAIFRNMTFDQ